MSMEPPKRVPLLSAPAKAKEEAKTYVFELKLGESNEQIYPEYSWRELVRVDEAKKVKEKNLNIVPVGLDPYASDDEDALKDMALKFEEKYNNAGGSSSPGAGKVRKRKRQAEDYIDRGAGYDETDSFIDNTDIYDEVVPEDLQTVHGGFYINSGALDYKEAEVSDGEEMKQDNFVNKKVLTKSSTPRIPPLKPETPVTATVTSSQIRNSDLDPPKKRRDSVSAQVQKARRKSLTENVIPKRVSPVPDIVKIKSENVASTDKTHSDSSSGSSETSSSEDDSSSSGSESSDGDATKKNELIKATIFRKSAVVPNSKPVPLIPQRRLKVKNVPLNPKLHGNNPNPAQAPVGALSNREIFGISSSSMNSMKGLNSLPAGLTVTANVAPPKVSPSLGLGLGVELKSSSGVFVNPLLSKANLKKPRSPKLNSMIKISPSANSKQGKPKTPAPLLQPSVQFLPNKIKYGSTSLAYPNINYQSSLQQSANIANLAILAGLKSPFLNEVKKKNRNSLNKSKNNNISPIPYSSNQLGTSITVTEVKEMSRQSSSSPGNNINRPSSSSPGIGNTGNRLPTSSPVNIGNRQVTSSPSNTFNNKSLNLSGKSGNNSPVNITKLPATFNLSNQSALNLSTSIAHHSKGSPLNLSSSNCRKNIKVTPHTVNSLLNYSANVNTILPLPNLTFGNGVSAVKDSQRK